MRNVPDVIDLGVEEVMEGLADGSMVLVDVREPNELALGTIPGSVEMPLSRFDPTALPLADGRRLVFSCAAGVRSRIAVALAQRAGIEARAHLAQGFKGWVAAGGPVDRGSFT